jgi:hypothetical protein
MGNVSICEADFGRPPTGGVAQTVGRQHTRPATDTRIDRACVRRYKDERIGWLLSPAGDRFGDDTDGYEDGGFRKANIMF